jgi:hypothetical protein
MGNGNGECQHRRDALLILILRSLLFAERMIAVSTTANGRIDAPKIALIARPDLRPERQQTPMPPSKWSAILPRITPGQSCGSVTEIL